MSSSRRRPRKSRETHQSGPQSTDRKRDDGILYKGKWYCNCEPRLEASHREVKKENANKGRLFYTCVSDLCRFYLWESDAQKRHETILQPDEAERQLVIEKPKAETQQQLTSFFQVTPSRRPIEDDVQPMETPCPPTSKRKRDAFTPEEDEESSYGLTSDDDGELIALADETVASARKGKQKATEPQPTASGRDPYITPATQRTVDVMGGLPTPSVTRNLFPSASNKRQKTVSFEEMSEPQTPSTCTTATVVAPTSSSASQPSTPATPSRQIPDVSEEVMPLLQGENITPNTLKSLRNVLVSSARKTKGVVSARDYLRGESSKKDTEISRLHERVAAVENKNKLQNRQVTNIRAGIMKLHDEISKSQVTNIEEIKARLMKLYEQN